MSPAGSRKAIDHLRSVEMSEKPGKKKAQPPLPKHSEESAAHRILGRAFGRMGHERSPAYPGDKKDKNLLVKEMDRDER